jgi:hypothetical protein
MRTTPCRVYSLGNLLVVAVFACVLVKEVVSCWVDRRRA